jgi:ferritin-like metal-binding protein YciE
MNQAQQKVVQYLGEAHTTEQALTRDLQAQIAMTPRGSYRSALEAHLGETRDHASRVRARLDALGQGSNPLTAIIGAAGSVVGQAVALGKAPLNLLRGSGGEEKLLKNAKDACAAEMLEIATYTALERLARAVGDDETARLAASIRADEERMHERVLSELPKLADAVVQADVNGEHAFDVTTTGAAETARNAGKATRDDTRKPASGGRTARRGRGSRASQPDARRKPAARRAAKKPADAQAGAARRDDLAIPGYDTLTAAQIVGRLASLSPRDRATIETHERQHKDRTTILNRIASLRPEQPTVAPERPRAADQGPGADDGQRAAGAGGAGADDDQQAAGTQGSGRPDPVHTTSGEPRTAADREPAEAAGGGGDRPPAAAKGVGEPGPVTATDGDRPAAPAEGPRETNPVTGPGADLRAAADAGDSAAAFTLWERLRDTERAAAERYLRMAADSGDVRAAHRFGMLLWRERGNPEGAVEWLDRAAQANDPAAERDLGILLREHGDIRGAYHWLSRAADRDGQARHALAELVENR